MPIRPKCAKDQEASAVLSRSAENPAQSDHGLLIKPITLIYPCFASALSRETALSDLPHSRQTRLARGVISPQ